MRGTTFRADAIFHRTDFNLERVYSQAQGEIEEALVQQLRITRSLEMPQESASYRVHTGLRDLIGLHGVDLRGAQFHGGTRFADGHWRNTVNFDGAQFHAEAIFEHQRFYDTTSFDGVKFSNVVGFAGGGGRGGPWTDFYGDASFRGATFSGLANFTGTRFLTRMPDFTGARITAIVIHAESAFATWRTRTIPPLQPDARVRFGSVRQARAGYIANSGASGPRTLRAALEASRNEPGSHLVYEIEMACRHKELKRQTGITARTTRTLITLYRLTSGYATRPVRCLTCLLILLIAAAALLALAGYSPTRPPLARIALDATRATIPGWSIPEDTMTTTGSWIITTARTTGAILLGLLALSIRNQLKR